MFKKALLLLMTFACLQSARCETRQDVITAAARDLLTEHATLKAPYPSGMMSFAFSVTEAENGRPDFWHSTGARFIIPAGLITYGAVAQFSPLLQEVNSDIKDGFLRIFPERTHVDDYLQYAPIAGYFALYGVKTEHNLLQRTLTAATAYLVMAAIVNTMKYTIPVLRPDGSAWNSFPSGHTATAFTGAHLLFREYKCVSPWIGIAGYTVATATGIMRMMNRRHWFSDVITGAGIGIVSVEIAYLLLPVFNKWIYGSKEVPQNFGLSITPIAGGGYYGAGIACVF